MLARLKRHTSMRGRLAILLVAALVLPLAGVGWYGYVSVRSQLEGAASTDHDVLLVESRLTVAATDFRARLRESLADLALRAVHLPVGVPLDPSRSFADLPEARRPVVAALVDAGPGSAPGVPPAVREALADELDAGRPLRGWRELPLGDALELCEVVLEPRGSGSVLLVRPLAPGLAGVGATDHLVRGVVLPDGRLLAGAATGALPEPFDDPAYLAENLWGPAGARSAGDDAGPLKLQRAGRLLLWTPLEAPLGGPSAVVAVASASRDDVLAEARRGALAAEALSVVGRLAAAGVLLALLIGLLAPRFVWRDIRDTTDFIFGSVDRLRELVRRIGVALDEQNRLLEHLGASVVRLDGESREIAAAGRALAHSAEQSEWTSHAGHQKAESAQRTVLDVQERVQDITRQMDELQRRCAAIGSILDYLDHLTDETGVVSINANIKAAGSDGGARQLAVMAAEIQKLAELARGSTREIAVLVGEIQAASRATLGTTQEGRQQVERCLAAFEEVEQNFGRILRWVEDTKRCAHGIEGGTARQSDALQSVSRDVASIGQRARETQANFEAVVDAADELGELGRRVNETWRVG